MTLSAWIWQTAKEAGHIPVLGPWLRQVVRSRLHLSFRMRHPIDAFYGIQTSGYVDNRGLASGDLFKKRVWYVGVQPSVFRRCMAALPDMSEYCFLDLGCGKGRPNVLATEFPFRKNIGIEISHQLAEIAKKNAIIMAEKFPKRGKIEIIEGDAVNFPLPGRKLVIFLYNPFNEELTLKLLQNIEKHLAQDLDHLFVVYHNAVLGRLFDASSHLKRWFAEQFVCEPSERKYGYPNEGATVIWQSMKNALPDVHSRADRKVIVRENSSTSLES